MENLEKQVKLLSKISEIFVKYPLYKVFPNVLKLILSATDSKYGVFGYIDQDENLVCPSMTTEIWWDQCNVKDKQFIFPKASWGANTSWAVAINKAKSTLSNTPSSNLPSGHIPIKRHMVVPIIYKKRPIGLFIVGNKEVPYDPADLTVLEVLGKHISPVLKTKLEANFELAAMQIKTDLLIEEFQKRIIEDRKKIQEYKDK